MRLQYFEGFLYLHKRLSSPYIVFLFALIIVNIMTTQSGSTEPFLLTTGQFGYPQPEAGFGYLNFSYDQSQGCPTCGIDVYEFQGEAVQRQKGTVLLIR
jgi:hypothetical protein